MPTAITYDYRCTPTPSSVAEMRAMAQGQRIDPRPALRFATDRLHWIHPRRRAIAQLRFDPPPAPKGGRATICAISCRPEPCA